MKLSSWGRNRVNSYHWKSVAVLSHLKLLFPSANTRWFYIIVTTWPSWPLEWRTNSALGRITLHRRHSRSSRRCTMKGNSMLAWTLDMWRFKSRCLVVVNSQCPHSNGFSCVCTKQWLWSLLSDEKCSKHEGHWKRRLEGLCSLRCIKGFLGR